MNGANGVTNGAGSGGGGTRGSGITASMREDGRAIVLTSQKGVYEVPLGTPVEKRWKNSVSGHKSRIIVHGLTVDRKWANVTNVDSKDPIEHPISLHGVRAYATKRAPKKPVVARDGGDGDRALLDRLLVSDMADAIAATEDKVDRIEDKIDRLLAMWEIKK